MADNSMPQLTLTPDGAAPASSANPSGAPSFMPVETEITPPQSAFSQSAAAFASTQTAPQYAAAPVQTAPQYAAAAIVSQTKQYCTPASVDSIPSSQNQEDLVSMGANAATKCYKVMENVSVCSPSSCSTQRRPSTSATRKA